MLALVPDHPFLHILSFLKYSDLVAYVSYFVINLYASGVAKRGRWQRPPIFQTKHKHTYKLHKICQFGQFIFGKIIKNCCHQISSFKVKMHQIRFWLGLCPRTRWGSSQRSPDPLAGF